MKTTRSELRHTYRMNKVLRMLFFIQTTTGCNNAYILATASAYHNDDDEVVSDSMIAVIIEAIMIQRRIGRGRLTPRPTIIIVIATTTVGRLIRGCCFPPRARLCRRHIILAAADVVAR